LPGLEDDVPLAERQAGDLGRIAGTIHLAHLVGAARERKHPARNESADDIVRAEVGVLHALFHEAYDPVCLVVRLLRIIAPVSFGGRRRIKRRQIYEIRGAGVLNIEEGPLP
jgi:hypothetical protein